MGLLLTSLDAKTRQFMVEEIDADVANGTVYLSPRLSAAGRSDYVSLLKQAAGLHTDDWLAQQLRLNGRLNQTEQRAKPTGGTTTVKVPVTAADMLAEGEFNRFYARGLCRRAVQEGITGLVIYRAKQVSNPRPD